MFGEFVEQELLDEDGRFMGRENAGIQLIRWWGTIFTELPKHRDLESWFRNGRKQTSRNLAQLIRPTQPRRRFRDFPGQFPLFPES